VLGAVTSEDIDLDQSHDCGAVLPAASVSILANKACRRIGHAGVRWLLQGGPWIARSTRTSTCRLAVNLYSQRNHSVVRSRNRHSSTRYSVLANATPAAIGEAIIPAMGAKRIVVPAHVHLDAVRHSTRDGNAILRSRRRACLHEQCNRAEQYIARMLEPICKAGWTSSVRSRRTFG
jgi:hypothetical protein